MDTFFQVLRCDWILGGKCQGTEQFPMQRLHGKWLHALNLLEQCHERDLNSGHQSDRRMLIEPLVTCKRVNISQVQQCFLKMQTCQCLGSHVQRSGAHLEGVIKYLSHRISLSVSRHDRGRILSSHSHRHVIYSFLNTSEYFHATAHSCMSSEELPGNSIT